MLYLSCYKYRLKIYIVFVCLFSIIITLSFNAIGESQIKQGNALDDNKDKDLELLINGLRQEKKKHAMDALCKKNQKKIVEIGRPAVPFLIDALSNNRSRDCAADTLGKIGNDASDAVPTLIGFLDEGNSHYNSYVISALGGIGKAASPAVPNLIKILHNNDTIYISKGVAIEALGNIGDRKAIPEIITAYTSKSERYDSRGYASLRLSAIKTLVKYKDPTLIDIFVTAIDDDYDLVQNYALLGINTLSKTMPEADFLQKLKSALYGKPFYVHQRVIDIFENSSLYPALIQQLSDHKEKKVYQAMFIYDMDKSYYVSTRIDNNNLYVFGPFLRKLHMSGQEQWSIKIPELDTINIININKTGSVFLAGCHNKNGTLTVAKVDRKGQIIWVKEASKLQIKHIYPGSISFKQDNSVIVVGTCSEDYLTSRVFKMVFTQDGQVTKITFDDKHNKNGYYHVKGEKTGSTRLITADDNGRVYLIFEPYRSDNDYRLARFDTNGCLEWMVPCKDFGHLGLAKVTLDKTGNVYLTGLSKNSRGRILKVNTNGQIMWSKNLNGTKIRGVSLTQNGDIMVGWNRWPSSKKAQIACLDSNGKLKSIKDVNFGISSDWQGFLIDLAASTSDAFAVVISWEKYVFHDKGADGVLRGSSLLIYDTGRKEL